MSVSEITTPREVFERTPPQDVAAEQSVIGGMLLSKDAIADVLEVLHGADFYRPAHEAIYEAVLDLYGRGEPADAVTVSAELTKRGELARVGGAPYLHTLLSSVPTAANAGFYARIVRERAVLRRLVDAGTRIVQLGYATDGGDVDDLVNTAQAEVYAVTERRTAEDYVPLKDVINATMEEIDAASHRGEGMVGVPTGFADLDSLTNGLHPGQMIVLAARPAVGKALALDTPLPTPTGWTTMGEVAVGDLLLAADGTPTRVTAATEVMAGRPCYEVTFDDGTTIVADAHHEWLTDTRAGEAIRTTAEIAAADAGTHRVRNARALDLPFRGLATEPYEVGAALGEASVSDEQAFEPYLRARERDRRLLLRRLLDAAGSVGPDGYVRVPASDVAQDLLAGLGYATRLDGGGGLAFATDDQVFGRHELQLAHKERGVPGPSHRTIVAVRRVASVPVRCVEIDHPSHLYLASRSMIPTHNSTLGLDVARTASIKHGMTSVIFSLEMSRNEISMRMLSAESQVPLQNMRKGTMRDEDWTRLARAMSRVSDAPLFIDDSPNMSLMEIRAKCRRLKQRHDLKLVVIDYLQLMSSGKRVESRQQEVSEFSRALKLLAKELEVPVIAISQLNRGSEQRTDKKPQMSDLRESGCLTADTRILRADTGAEVTMGDLYESGAKDVPVWALDDRLKYVRRHLTHVFSTGTKPVYRLRLASGKEITATANHPFLSYDGWTPLGELEVGSRVGVPRHVPVPEAKAEWDDERVVVAARALGGPFGSRVPEAVFCLPKRQITLFLRHLWSVRVEIAAGEVSTPLANRELADGVARLLLRFGISTRVHDAQEPVLTLLGNDDRRRFLQEIGIEGARAEAAARMLAEIWAAEAGRTAPVLPIWDEVRTALTAPPQTDDGAAMEPLGRVATLLHEHSLEVAAINDVIWDSVVAIEHVGIEEVFDATVVGTHNFVANGIAVHNSIEQDADVVILLHREDMYEKESPRAGEADMIVAKHRNGPTDTIVVAFQGHYARFVDMAQ